MSGVDSTLVPKPSLLDLPVEVQRHILQQLDQNDFLNLALTNKAAAELTLQHIYHTVVVGRSPVLGDFSRSLVTTFVLSQSLDAFLKAERRTETRILELDSLPKKDSMSDSQSLEAFEAFFSGLHRLQALSWKAGMFPLDLLWFLPNRACLTSLKIFGEIGTIDSSILPKISLPLLQHLSIKQQPCIAEYLRYIFGNPLQSSVHLKSLHLIGDKAKPKFALGHDGTPGFLSILTGWDLLSHFVNEGIKIMPCVFSSGFSNSLNCLKTLTLDSIIVSNVDAVMMVNSCSLNTLENFFLENVADLPTSQSPECGFLMTLAPHLKSLRRLRIRYFDSYEGTVAQFLMAIPILSGLYLSLPSYVMGREGDNDSQIKLDYVSAINRHLKLQRLALLVPSGWAHLFMEGIGRMRWLVGLSIDIERGKDLSEIMNIQGLKSLRYFDVTYDFLSDCKKSGADIEDTYSTEEVDGQTAATALVLWRLQEHLLIVRLNNKIFAYDEGDVLQNDTLHRWIDDYFQMKKESWSTDDGRI